MRRRPSSALACLVLALAARGLDAQVRGSALAPPGPNIIAGVVTDEAGLSIGEADVIIESLHRRVPVRADGSFRIDSVPEGEYEIYARRMGYVGAKGKARVGRNGAFILLKLVQFRFTLPTTQTTAERGGLSGTIADAGFLPLADISVSVIGASGKARSDANGEFFLPLAPGSYVVQLEGSGYAKQIVGVRVPADSGRRLAVWMERQRGRPDPVRSRNLFDLEQRLIWESRLRLRIFTRDDMARLGTETVLQLANIALVEPVPADCLISVNGGPEAVPLWLLNAEDIEFVEMMTSTLSSGRIGSVGGRGAARGPTSLTGSQTKFSTRIDWGKEPRGTEAGTCGHMVAWLR